VKTATSAPAEPDPAAVELAVLRVILMAEDLPIMDPADEPIVEMFAQAKPKQKQQTKGGADDQARGTGSTSEIREHAGDGAGTTCRQAHNQRVAEGRFDGWED
jgi:hypothetical protein